MCMRSKGGGSRWRNLPAFFVRNNRSNKWNSVSQYAIICMLSYPIRQRKGGVNVLESIISFIVTVVAGVACHYIIKWLDSDK